MTKLNQLAQNNEVSPEDNPILVGNFAPVDREQDIIEFEVTGVIPDALNGTLLRNGPNPVNPQPNHHWFAGDGMLHAITLGNGKATSYRNRWVRTEALQEKLSLPAAPVSDTKPMVQGSGNVNVVYHGGRVLALPELGLPYEMDAELNTRRMYDYEGKLTGSMTAHPKIDSKTGEMLFFGYDVMPPFLKFHTADADGKLIRSVEIELPECVMMHDFGVTETRVVFMDLPVVGDFSLLEKGFNMPFRWSDDHQARLGVLDRHATTDTVHWIDIDPCYVFHPMNSFDQGNLIIMDVVKYQKMFTSAADGEFEGGAQLVRWTIDPANDTVKETVLSDLDQEFPRINPQVECHPHRYGYSLLAGGTHGFTDLVKHDLETGETTHHLVGDNCAGGEPVFIPTGVAEDQGYILSVVYNGDTQTSELHIVDAQNFSDEPVATIKLGARVPFGFHGNFVPAG